MTLLEFAEKTSPVPLNKWQRELFIKYEEALRDGKQLTVIPGRDIGRTIAVDIINKYYGKLDGD